MEKVLLLSVVSVVLSAFSFGFALCNVLHRLSDFKRMDRDGEASDGNEQSEKGND